MNGSPPHVVFFLPSLGGGGAERVLINFANGLSHHNIQVTILLVTDDQGVYREEISSQVTVRSLACRRALTAIPQLVRYLWSERPQILIPTLQHLSILGVLAGMFVPGLRIYPRVAVSIAAAHHEFSAITALLVRALLVIAYHFADGVIVPSRELKNEVMRAFRIRAKKIRIVPSPHWSSEVDRKSKERSPHRWLQPGGPAVILGVGRLTPQKGYDSLLRAFAGIKTRDTVRLLILGEGPEQRKLEELAVDLGISEITEFGGFTLNPYSYILRAKVFVLPSLYEGLPGTLVQALCLGSMVVAADCPTGPRRLLCSGKRGQLSPPGDSACLQRCLERALQTPHNSNPSWLKEFRRTHSYEYAIHVLLSLVRETTGAAIPD